MNARFDNILALKDAEEVALNNWSEAMNGGSTVQKFYTRKKADASREATRAAFKELPANELREFAEYVKSR